MDKDYFVEFLLDTYCTITQMRINIAEALNNCLIALYFSSQLLSPVQKHVISDMPTEDGLLRQLLKELECVAG